MIIPITPYKGLRLDVIQTAGQASAKLTWDAPLPPGAHSFDPCEVAWEPGTPAPLLDSSVDFAELEFVDFNASTLPLVIDLTRLVRPGGELSIVIDGRSDAKEELLTYFSAQQFIISLCHERSILATKPQQNPSSKAEGKIKPSHREPGYSLLQGEGLEIGAFTEPAPVPLASNITYFDAIDTATAKKLFPEVAPGSLVEVDVVGDVDRDGLDVFARESFDFIICNHVIEHVANPVRLISNLFALIKAGGLLVIAAPDKRFTFDHERALTSFNHVWDDYKSGVTTNSDEHYIDLLIHAAPHLMAESASMQAVYVEQCRARREHAHVWDSTTFRQFILTSLERLGLKAEPQFESFGDANRIEYFGVWRKAAS